MNIIVSSNKMKHVFINPKIEIVFNIVDMVYILKINSTSYTIDFVNTTYDKLLKFILENKSIILCLDYRTVAWISLMEVK